MFFFNDNEKAKPWSLCSILWQARLVRVHLKPTIEQYNLIPKPWASLGPVEVSAHMKSCNAQGPNEHLPRMRPPPPGP